MTQRTPSVLRRLAMPAFAVLFGCGLGLIVAEIGLRMFWPGGDKYYLWPPHLTATFHPSPEFVHGVSPVAHVSVNSQGVRAREWAADRSSEYRVLAVGGSTTQCVLQDQDKAWPALLEKELGVTADGRKVWIGNLGRAGTATRDHLGLMRLALDQYPVDAIVMMIGGNDLIGKLLQGDSYDPDFINKEEQYNRWLLGRFAMVPLAAQTRGNGFWRRTAMWQVGRWVNSLKTRRQNIQMDSSGHWLGGLRENRQKAKLVDETPPLDTALDEYQRVVTLIAEEARKRSIRIVFLTQPTFWKEGMSAGEEKLLWMGMGASRSDPAAAGQPWWKASATTMYTSAAMAKAMDRYNNRLLATCTKLDLECLDAAQWVPRNLDMFWDDMHFTDAASERVAREMLAYLKTRDPFRTSLAGPAARPSASHP